MVQKVQILRTSTPDQAPAALSPGELAIEMASLPPRLWVGVPANVDATGMKMLLPASSSSLPPKITKFTADGTFAPDANCVHGYAVGIGGGGGGGSYDVTLASQSYGTPGGASGNKVTTYFVASDVMPSVAVTIAAGGPHGGVGGDTSFGSLLLAKGGGGAMDYRYPGAPTAVGNVGDIIEYGAPGSAGGYLTASAGYGPGGSGGGAGGGAGVMAYTSYLYGLPGIANSGGGGGGGSCMAAAGGIIGGAGGSGYLYVVEYLK